MSTTVSQPKVAGVNSDERKWMIPARLIARWRHLSKQNQSVLAIALFSSLVAAVVVLILWTAGRHYVPLYGKQELFDKTHILELLEKQEVSFRLDQSSGEILVSEGQLAQIRMLLAGSGVKAVLPAGMEGLESVTGFGASQFMESMRYRHALEGELARTIITLNTVRNARVHLAVPKRTLFVGREELQPSASVTVDLMPGQVLDRGQVKAIMNLVSSSVSGMKPEQVSLVDQAGRLLSAGVSDDESSATSRVQHIEYLERVERRLIRHAEDMLVPLLGRDNFRVKVTVDIDFNVVEQTEESLSPEGFLVSEATKKTSSDDNLAMGIPGALSNIPPVKTDNEDKSDNTQTNQRSESVRKYETGRSIVHTQYQQGRIKHLSISVLLNDSSAQDDDGWTEQQRNDISAMVKGAIGFDRQRGDEFSINAFTFIAPVQIPQNVSLQDPIWRDLARYLVGGILGLVLIFIGVRPLVKYLLNAQKASITQAALLIDEPLKSTSDVAAVSIMEGGDVDASQGLGNTHVVASQQTEELNELPPPGSEFEVQLSHLRLLADKETARVAEVIKVWMDGNERN
jgi:flagellar M-ring protein FliF